MDKLIPVVEPLRPMTVAVPEKFQHCDMIEIRVTITPLTWAQDQERYLRSEHGEILGSQVAISRLEATESRAVISVVRQMIRELAMCWLGLKDLW